MPQRDQIRALKKELKKMNEIKGENLHLKNKFKSMFDEYQKVVPELEQKIAKLKWEKEGLKRPKGPFGDLLEFVGMLGTDLDGETDMANRETLALKYFEGMTDLEMKIYIEDRGNRHEHKQEFYIYEILSSKLIEFGGIYSIEFHTLIELKAHHVVELSLRLNGGKVWRVVQSTDSTPMNMPFDLVHTGSFSAGDKIDIVITTNKHFNEVSRVESIKEQSTSITDGGNK